MRVYKLQVGDIGNRGSVLNIELSGANPCAPKIEFNIQSFDDSGNAKPSFVKVYNVSVNALKSAPSLVGKLIKLEAGISQSMLAKLANVSPVYSKTLLDGIVDGCQASIEGTEVAVSFYVTPTLKQQEGFASVEIKPGAPAAKAFKKSLETFYRKKSINAPKIKILPTAASLVNDSKEAYIKNTDETNKNNALRWIIEEARNFCLQIGYDAQKNTITISPIRKMMKGSKLERFINLGALTAKKLKEGDFVAQHSWESLTQARFLLHLNASWAIGDIMQVPNSVVFSSGSIIDSLSNVALQGKSLSVVGGKFEVVSIEHKGNSRDENAEAWSTEITGVATT